MDFIQLYPFLDVLLSAINTSFSLMVSEAGDESFKVYPNQYLSSAWNGFSDLAARSKPAMSTAEAYKQFIFLILRVMSFMSFGFAIYDSALVMGGKGSAAESRGGKSKMLSKNILIMIVSAMVFEAETVMNGTWEYLKSDNN